MGIIYRNIGNVDQAIEYHEHQLALSRKIGDRTEEANALGSLGNAYKAFGNARKAKEFYELDFCILKTE
jgi:tetratricopeptide (TPR) repeat protein